MGVDIVSRVNHAIEDRVHSAPTAEELEQNSLRRRLWLLQHALRSVLSLLEALKIAEEAEAFVAAGAVSRSFNNIQKNIAAAPFETAWKKPHAMSQAAASSLLELEKKAAISARLEAGGSNAQLAAEFGLTPRQVQGFRMQLARREKRRTAAFNGSSFVRNLEVTPSK